MCDVQHKSWGFDFHRNEALERPVFGEYSTEIFTTQAEDIIAHHNTSEVCSRFSDSLRQMAADKLEHLFRTALLCLKQLVSYHTVRRTSYIRRVF
jgi:hypothetical protein